MLDSTHYIAVNLGLGMHLGFRFSSLSDLPRKFIILKVHIHGVS